MPERSVHPLVSVVIPVRDAERTIGDQLAALSNQDFDGEWELIVADNGSRDGTREVVEGRRRSMPSLRLVDASQRSGSNHARIVGTGKATGDLLLYCDADDVVCPGWISSMVTAAGAGDLVAGLPRWDSLNHDDHYWQFPHRQWKGHEGQHGFLPFATGASFGVRRSALEAVGGWDPSFVISGGDTDLAWRVQLAGYNYVFAPDACVQKRDRSSPKSYAKQHFYRGIGAAQLHAKFKADGMPGSDPFVAMKTWAWVLVNAPRAALKKEQRAMWLKRVSIAAGRIVGSIRFRTLYL